MKKTRILVALVVALGLFLATTQAFASPAAIAAGDSSKTPAPHGKPTGQPGQSGGIHGKPTNYKGVISAVDPSSLTLTLADGSSVSVGLSTDTRIQVPGVQNATAADLQTGMTVMVQARPDDIGNLIASFVHAIPGKPARVHRVGWVTEYTEGVSLTIQASDGNFYTFTLTADTKILPAERAAELAVGSRVTVIAPRDPASPIVTAQGIVVHPAGSGEGSMPPAATATPAP
jgi:hypothetical protein